jgi:putative acetyltransferase
VRIRSEEPRDGAAVHALYASAFETPAEARLVDALRERARPLVSLVAEDGAALVGHVLFSPVTLPGRREPRIMGLGPMAVAGERRGEGIGSALVRAGLNACRGLGSGGVVVLGHPGYYPRFGFAPASGFGLGCEYPVPDDVFLALELEPGCLQGVSGTVRYHPAFASV